jgi:hypothetical protein
MVCSIILDTVSAPKFRLIATIRIIPLNSKG